MHDIILGTNSDPIASQVAVMLPAWFTYFALKSASVWNMIRISEINNAKIVGTHTKDGTVFSLTIESQVIFIT